MPGRLPAREVVTPVRDLLATGIFAFCVRDPLAFWDAFIRQAATLRQNGLMADIRNNGGGQIHASETILQTRNATAHHAGAGSVRQPAAQPEDLLAAQGQPIGHQPRSLVRQRPCAC
jgi:hypothetical protein